MTSPISRHIVDLVKEFWPLVMFFAIFTTIAVIIFVAAGCSRATTAPEMQESIPGKIRVLPDGRFWIPGKPCPAPANSPSVKEWEVV